MECDTMGCLSTAGNQPGNKYVLRGGLDDGITESDILSRMSANAVFLSVYRLNTYPLIHLGFIHAILNTLALAPLLERFEADHGTLLTAAMFVGRTFKDTLLSEWGLS